MSDQNWDYCAVCDGEGYYLFDSDIYFSWGNTTHKYLAECDECNGSGKIYDEEDQEDV